MGETHFSGPVVSDTQSAHIAAANEAHSATTDTDTAAHLKTALDALGAKLNLVIVALETNGITKSS